jgi:predicted nucleotidyltransferase component of viral defense system
MLQTETIQPGTLSILKELMKLNELQSFLLVGGTALSLYYGHRLSIDIDLFSTTEFQNELIAEALQKRFEGFSYRINNAIGIFGFINMVKVDLIKHHHVLMIEEPVVEQGIRLMSIPDLAAMKINAIMKRGVKKDFWDIAELLQHYSLADLISFYKRKYPNQQLLVSVPRAIVYFNDAEETEDPLSLKDQTWESVKNFIEGKVSIYLK